MRLINNRNLFLTVWRLKVQDKVSAWLGSGEHPLLGYRLLTLHPHVLERARHLSRLSSQGTNPIHQGSALRTYSLPTSPCLNAFTLGIRFSRYEMGSEGHSQTVEHTNTDYFQETEL